MKVLLDTNICIYLIKNKPEGVRRQLERYRPGEVGISAVTEGELRYGVAKSQAREKNAATLEAFLLPLEVLPFGTDAAARYGEIRAALERKGTPIGQMDLLIAAHALAAGVALATNNMREFRRVPGLRCENWL